MSEADETPERKEPCGLGGWLILVGLGLVLGPLRLGNFVFRDILPIFMDGTWELLTTPGSQAYDPRWAPLLVFETAGNSLFLAAGLVLLLLFVVRSRWFPGLYIAVALLNIVFVLGDAWLGSLVLPDDPVFDPETAGELGRAVGGAVVWVPYMLVSKRVRNTFVA